MPIIDYTTSIQEYNKAEPSDLDGFTTRLAEYRGNMVVWRGMLCYTLWRAVYKQLIPIGGATAYVKDNMTNILGGVSENRDYIVSLAGVVDVILADMWQMYQAETPYLDEDDKPISIEMIIFNPKALTHAYTFKGFYKDTIKREEAEIIDFETGYNIRHTLLTMFLTSSRADIKAYRDEIKAEIIESDPDSTPVTVIEVGIDGEYMVVGLSLSSDAYDWLQTTIMKKYSVSLSKLG